MVLGATQKKFQPPQNGATNQHTSLKFFSGENGLGKNLSPKSGEKTFVLSRFWDSC